MLALFDARSEDNHSASAPNTATGKQVRYFSEGREVSPDELPLQMAVARNEIIAPMWFDTVEDHRPHLGDKANQAGFDSHLAKLPTLEKLRALLAGASLPQRLPAPERRGGDGQTGARGGAQGGLLARDLVEHLNG